MALLQWMAQVVIPGLDAFVVAFFSFRRPATARLWKTRASVVMAAVAVEDYDTFLG